MLDRGWSLGTLRGFDLFPMTEHVEVVGFLEPPAGRADLEPPAGRDDHGHGPVGSRTDGRAPG